MNFFNRFLIRHLYEIIYEIIIRFRVVIDVKRFLWMFDRFKKLRFEHIR